MKWIWIILALAYLLSPYDLIPGFSAVSWLDDIFILVLLFRYLANFNRLRRPGTPPYGEGPHQQQQHQDSQETQHPSPPRTPYDILGVSPDATHDEIKSAYRQLVNQYHPDKVTHLGEEFQTLAEKRFKEIQEAYQQLER